jgi:hypothetical protein
MRPGKRLITCPETHATAAIDINLFQRMSDCSRWPEKAGCDQACLSQVHAAPEDCLVRKIVAAWYAGKRCAVCEREIGAIVWHEKPPALLAPDGATREWTEVAAEELPAIFTTHAPLCWTCHLAMSFRREHPELVFERPRIAEKRTTLQPTTAVY